MSGTIKIALIDNYQLMRQCLQNYLLQSGFTIVSQTSSGRNLINRLTKENAPDVCIIDVDYERNVELSTIKYLHAHWPNIKIVVYSLDPYKLVNDRTIPEANAILSKHSSLAELKETLERLGQQKTALAR